MTRYFRHGRNIAVWTAQGKAALLGRRARRAALARGRLLRLEVRAGGRFRRAAPPLAVALAGAGRGYDPELLYVECGRCGAPVLWEPGRATRLLDEAGIDPLELDASCLLVTNACPMCGGTTAPGGPEGTGEPDAGAADADGEAGYVVRVFRMSAEGGSFGAPRQGHA